MFTFLGSNPIENCLKPLKLLRNPFKKEKDGKKEFFKGTTKQLAKKETDKKLSKQPLQGMS